MKTTITAIAIAMASTAAFSAEAIRSNVPCDGGSKPGFVVISGSADYFVINGMNEGCPAGTTELPVDVHPFDADAVKAYLGNDVDLRLQGNDRETRLVDGVLVETTSRPVNGGW